MKKIQRVLLISLHAVLEDVDTYLEDGHSFHLGLAYIAAVLRAHGLAVTILDSYVEDRSNLRSDVEPGWLELGLSDEQILIVLPALIQIWLESRFPFRASMISLSS